MKWIPAVALILGFINCDSDPKPQPQPPAADAGAQKADAADPEKSDGEAAANAVPEEPKNAPFLWKVTRPNYHTESWIYGTINDPQAPVEFELAPEKVQLAMQQVSDAVFEVPTGSAAQRDRTKLMAMKEGSLRKELGSKRIKKLTEITGEQKRVLDVMKPWVVYLAMEEKLSAELPMDEAWEGFASSYRKQTEFLETVREQVSVLEKALDFETVGGLVDDFDKHKEATAAIAQAYETGNADALKAAQFPPDSKRAAVHKALIDLRNDRWAAKLNAQFDKDDTLVVLNTRYLVGPDNIIAKLREKGWTVERQSAQ